MTWLTAGASPIWFNAAFGRTFHNAAEYQNLRFAPCFRRDLDLVAVAPDGSFAAYIGIP